MSLYLHYITFTYLHIKIVTHLRRTSRKSLLSGSNEEVRRISRKLVCPFAWTPRNGVTIELMRETFK